MKTLLFGGMFFLASTSFSQIHLILSDFAMANDTVRMSTASPTTVDFTSTGTNQTWDFSSLSPTSQELIHFPDISNAGPMAGYEFGPFSPPQYRADYFLPATDLPIGTIGSLLPTIQIEDVFRYFNTSGSAITSIGLSISTSMGNIPKKSDTIETFYPIPLDFGDSYHSRGYTKMDFNPFYDAIYLQHRDRSTIVDGYGTVITPFGSFQALRVHHTINEVDSFYVNFSGFSQWIPIPVPTSHEYEWWAKDQKLPVMKIVTSALAGNETVTKITYRDKFRYDLVASTEDYNAQTKFSIYPNPADDVLTIESVKNIKTVLIYDQSGKLLLKKAISPTKITTLDISQFAKGTYFICCKMDGNTVLNHQIEIK